MLPALPDLPNLSALPESSPAGDPSLRSLTILVVDDDEYIHIALAGALRSLRARFVRASCASEGLELARHHRPHLAIVDLGLPDRDGYALTRELRSVAGLDDMPIVILTGHLTDEDAALAAGADRIVGKPFRLHEFLEAVTGLLRSNALAS